MTQSNHFQYAGLDKAFAANPGMTPTALPQPKPTERMMLAGGLIGAEIAPNEATPLEHLFRKLPVNGIYTATPQKPVVMELGSFTVPPSMAFVLLDYRFDIYRPSGVAPNDYIPIENRRLSTQIGWAFQSSAQQQGNWRYQLMPALPTVSASSTAYTSRPNPGIITGEIPQPAVSQATYDQLRAQQAQATTIGLATMPQRHHREGLLKHPYSWVLAASQTLQIQAIVFERVPIPITFFEASMTGWLLPQSVATEFLDKCRFPPTIASR